MIPKGDKDPKQVSNYRPISLLRVDVKIYAKILASRLTTYLPKLIHTTINIQHWLSLSKSPGFLLYLDLEKVFDRVSWIYLEETLKAF